MGKILAVVNQKGGVGKTTTAVNLAASLAVAERPVLLVDLDPQGNASSALGLRVKDDQAQVYDVLMGELGADEAIVESDLPNLAVLPAGRDLVGAELELVQAVAREQRLKDALEALKQKYHYILIDCPPSLGLLTLNALTAADGVLIPVQTEYFAMEGVGHLVHTIELVRRHLNPELAVHGVLLTMADFRTNLARQVADELRDYFGDKVFETVIVRNIRLSEAPSHGRPVLLYDVASRGSQNYLALAEELLARDGGDPA